MGSSTTYFTSEKTTSKDPSNATWIGINVAAVNLDDTALRSYSRDRFDERFVDTEFIPGPEASDFMNWCFVVSSA